MVLMAAKPKSLVLQPLLPFFCNWSLSDLILASAYFGQHIKFLRQINVCPSRAKIGHFFFFFLIRKVPRVSGDQKTILKNMFIAQITGVLQYCTVQFFTFWPENMVVVYYSHIVKDHTSAGDHTSAEFLL